MNTQSASNFVLFLNVSQPPSHSPQFNAFLSLLLVAGQVVMVFLLKAVLFLRGSFCVSFFHRDYFCLFVFVVEIVCKH